MVITLVSSQYDYLILTFWHPGSNNLLNKEENNKGAGSVMMRPFHFLIVHKISFISGVVFYIFCLINSFVLLILHFIWLCDY